MSRPNNYPVKGSRYRHYKGHLYGVLEVAINEADKVPVVVYTEITPEGYRKPDAAVWVRPVASWLEEVVVANGVGRCPRFELDERRTIS